MHLSKAESHEKVELREHSYDAVIHKDRDGGLRHASFDVKSPD